MFLTALTVVALGANSAIPAAVREQFAQWKAKHGVKYASPQEEDVRLANFHSNLVTIAHLNAASANATAGARFGANKFADRSAKELAGLRGFHGHVAMAMRRNATNVAARLPTDATPDSYDWRSQRGIIAPVQDQGQCGSCWAFSATANLESRYAIATKTPVNKLAEQLLVDCEHNCGTFRDMNGCDAGCNGGLMPNAFVYAMANGDAIESSYPYTGADGTCQSFSRVGRWTGWEFVPEDEDQIAAYLAANGPVSVAVDASMWSFYLGGIMQSWFICGNPLAPDSSLDHGVMLVGFGEEGGVKYWIVRNSWAASWGEEGYARILRGAGFCGVNLFACSSKV